ncbi:sigma-70, region 4 family protein [Burkholderia sp. MSHR3999]|nr:sigma-70, region 4 family protein [Burkholderia sp. MSHR3999]
MMRGALTQLVLAQPDMTVVSELAFDATVIGASGRYPADLMLIDAPTSISGWIDLIQKLHVELPTLPLLVLVALDDAPAIPRISRSSAKGCVARESEPTVLLEAVRLVAAGERFIDPALIDAVFFGETVTSRSLEDGLSKRERQVLQFIASGYSLSDIARSLSLSIKTISTHKIRMMRKLNVDNNAELMRYALRHGVVTHR